MNWTGGRLQRHSRTSINAVTAKQKQHFAKARARLQNGDLSRSTPFQPSFLQEDKSALPMDASTIQRRPHHHAKYDPCRQSTLDEYDVTVPVVRRLSSLKTYRPYQGTSRSSPQHEPPTIPDNCASDCGGSKSLAPKASSSSHENESPKKPMSKREDSETRQSENDRLEVDRKRLLQQEDWIGLGQSQPLQIDFNSRPHGIGKRRKFNSSMRNRKLTLRKPSISPTLMDVTISNGRPLINSTVLNEAEDIQVRIGTAALHSQNALMNHNPEAALRKADEIVQSSDTMLFDEHEQHNGDMQQLLLAKETSGMSNNEIDERETSPRHVDERGIDDLLWSLSDLDSMNSISDIADKLSESEPIEWKERRANIHSNARFSVTEENVDLQDSLDEGCKMQAQEDQYHGFNEHIFDGFNTNFLNGICIEEQSTLGGENPADSTRYIGVVAHDDKAAAIRATNTDTGSGFRKFYSLLSSGSGSWNDHPHPHRKGCNQAIDALATFKNPGAHAVASFRVTASADSHNIADMQHESGSAITELQSPSVSLFNIRKLSERPHAQTKRQRNEATSEEMLKRLLFGSRADSSSNSDRSVSSTVDAYRPARKALASSMLVERGTAAVARPTVEQETPAFDDDLGSSLFVCCTTGSPVSMATRTSNDKAECRIRANLNAWGSGMEGLNDDSPALRKLQFNIHAPSAPPHVTQAERTSGPSMTRRKEAAAGAPSPHLSGSSAEVGRLSTARSSTSQHEGAERPLIRRFRNTQDAQSLRQLHHELAGVPHTGSAPPIGHA